MTVKICVRCGEQKSLEYFCKAKNYKDGRRGTCKKCHTEYQKKYYKDNEDKRQAKNKMNTKYVPSWKRHHLTKEQYEELFNKFNGKCHICRIENGYAIDHDHSCCDKNRSCGKCVRGILCRGCNTALGNLKENANTVLNLIKYIGLA